MFTNALLDISYSMEAKVVLQVKRFLVLKKYLNILIVVASSFRISSCLATLGQSKVVLVTSILE